MSLSAMPAAYKKRCLLSMLRSATFPTGRVRTCSGLERRRGSRMGLSDAAHTRPDHSGCCPIFPTCSGPLCLCTKEAREAVRLSGEYTDAHRLGWPWQGENHGRVFEHQECLRGYDCRPLRVQKVVDAKHSNACHNCGERGHYIRDCPELQKLN